MKTGVILGSKPNSNETDIPYYEYQKIADAPNSDLLYCPDDFFFRKFTKSKAINTALYVASIAKNYDKLYFTGEDYSLLSAILLKFMGWRGKIVSIFHSVIASKKSKLLKLFGHGLFYKVIVVSQRQKDYLVAELGYPEDKVVWRANFIDTDYFKPDKTGFTSPYPSKPYIFACGQEERDYITLIKAAKNINADVVLSMRGFRPSSHNIDPNDIAPNVHILTDRIPWRTLSNYYKFAELIVIPLKNSNYAAGVTGLMEAMANAKAVVCTNSEGIGEYLAATNVGEIVPPHDINTMSEAVNKLLADEKLRNEIGVKNREWIMNNADVNAYGQYVLDL